MKPARQETSVPGECTPAGNFAQPQGAHQLGAHGIGCAEEDDKPMFFSSAEDLKRALASGALGVNLHPMNPNGLVLLGFVVQRGSVKDMLPKLTDALPAVWRFHDAGDEVAVPGEGVHDQQQGSTAQVVGQGADDAHAGSPIRGNWLLTEGSVPLSQWPEEVGHLPVRMVLSPRIGAWLNHLVCIDLESKGGL